MKLLSVRNIIQPGCYAMRVIPFHGYMVVFEYKTHTRYTSRVALCQSPTNLRHGGFHCV